ncbi:nickel/cobalt transporter [Bordetella sp. LUAb4]|uniref:nickel/cobalt transporter n=1 Tax=Bordetella sp. LUAb4 TaxID=2843195 RepID=UPI001E33FF2F|nr:nickel/cobalt transporter [Bordetella sp. LUAb4]
MGLWLAVFIGMLLSGLLLPVTAAPHPFGVPEAGGGAMTGPDWLLRLFGWVSAWQSHFYRQLTGALRAWQDDAWAAWPLVGLSFAYGIFHALGPGHGKAVVATYVLANRQTARNGAVLALLSALVQALVAILLVSVAAGILRVTAGTMNAATRWLETGSFAMIAMLGAWLVWRKAIRPLWPSKSSADRAAHAGHSHDHDHGPHVHGIDCDCGHAHVPPTQAVAGRLDLRKAWSAILAVGLRPCSGALIVLVFALAQDFYLAGVVSALAMGLGTGLTVAALVWAAVAAGDLLIRGGARLSPAWAGRLRYATQACAAVAVFAFGLLLLGGAVSGTA